MCNAPLQGKLFWECKGICAYVPQLYNPALDQVTECDAM